MSLFSPISRIARKAARDPISTLGFWKALSPIAMIGSAVASAEGGPLWHAFALLALAAVASTLASAIAELKNPGEDHAFARSFGDAASVSMIFGFAIFDAFAPAGMLHGWGLCGLLTLCAVASVLILFERAATEVADEKKRRAPARVLAKADARRPNAARGDWRSR